MDFLFGKQKTPREVLRENQRLLRRSVREIERERISLQQQEKKIIVEIKKSAKQGQMGAAKILAKDLVRTRNQIQKFYKMKTQLQAVSLRIQTLNSNVAMAEAMKGVTRAMIRLNRTMNVPAMQQVMMEFERQSEMMDMKEDLMNDCIDDAFDEAEDEEESEAILNQVLDDININLNSQLANAPVDLNEAKKTKKMELDADSELQARLDNLKR
jgi:charged multivesicular body protein 2A